MSEHTPVFGGGADDKLMSAAEGRRLATFADAVARWTLYLTLLLLPLFYLPGFVDGIELPKQGFLIAATVVAVIAWLGKMLVTRRLEIRRSVMHLFVVLYAAVYLLAAWFSKGRYVSFVGDYGQQLAGFSSLLCFVLLYFVAVNVLRDAKDVKRAIGWMSLGGLLVLVQSYLQAFGVHALPGTSGSAASFNTIGTSNSVGVYAAMGISIAMGMFLMPEKDDRWSIARKVAMGLLLALGAVYIATLQFWALWVMLIVGSAVLVGFGMLKTDRSLRVTMLAIPMAAIVIGVLFSFIRFPFSLGMPAEVMPSLRASWNISREALANRPLLGSGPGTFLYDYTQFRSKDLNATDFWSVQFDRSSSRFLTLLATTGILGLATLLIMLLYLAARTKMKLWRGHDDWLVTLAVFAGWSALFVGKMFYSTNMTLEFAFWMLTAMLVALQWNVWSEARFDQSPRAALGLSFLFIVAVIFSVSGLYLEGQRLVAEAHYAKGLTTDVSNPENVDKAVKELVRAGQLNGQNDQYFRALSQAFAVQANVEASKAGNQPTDEQSQKIALLAANAVNAGKHATDLAPDNVKNWESLAALYRDLGPSVPGATDAALEAYKKAASLDPSNPTYPTELGKVYLALADGAQASIGKDTKEEDKAKAQKAVEDNLTKSREQLDAAVALKQDYAPAHYWIAVILARQGKTSEAVAKLESVRNYNPNDLGVGFQLAILYYQDKQTDKAIAELQRLIKINPDYSNARWYLSVMLEEKGDLDGAIAQIEAVLKANPDNADVQKRLDTLKAKKSGAPAPAPEGGLPEPVEASPSP